MAKPYRVIARIKNNRLWTAILNKWPGVIHQSDAARRLGVSATKLSALLNMRNWPYLVKSARWSPIAVKIAEALGETEEHLFDGELYGRRPSLAVVEIDRPALEAAGLLALPPSPDEVLETDEMKEEIHRVVAGLNFQEQEVLARRFGLSGDEEMTLGEVAAGLGLSKERIRQIETKALRKLRTPKRAFRLITMLDEPRSDLWVRRQIAEHPVGVIGAVWINGYRCPEWALMRAPEKGSVYIRRDWIKWATSQPKWAPEQSWPGSDYSTD